MFLFVCYSLYRIRNFKKFFYFLFHIFLFFLTGFFISQISSSSYILSRFSNV